MHGTYQVLDPSIIFYYSISLILSRKFFSPLIFVLSPYSSLLYEALQDQSTAVPITVHMALWYILAVPYIN